MRRNRHRPPRKLALPVGLVVSVGLVVTALIAPVAEAKPLLAGSRQASDEVAPAFGGNSDVSWNDVMAGLAAGAVLAYLAMRAVRSLRVPGAVRSS
jgi:hypothetical protein